MMKRAFVLAVFVLLTAAAGFAQEDLAKAPSCKYCGMDRGKFSHSRMMISYDDGAAVGTCSLHCAAVDLSLNIDKTPALIGVGDYGTKKLIDAEKAFWVVGGGKPGVMSKRAKWAFEQKGDAEAFVKDNGGALVSFNEAVKAAYEDMYQDTTMIREKRKMMKVKAKEHQHAH